MLFLLLLLFFNEVNEQNLALGNFHFPLFHYNKKGKTFISQQKHCTANTCNNILCLSISQYKRKSLIRK